MSRVLFMAMGAVGHVNPLVHVAEGLLASGIDVHWLSRRLGARNVPPPSLPGLAAEEIDWSWLPPDRTLDFAGSTRTLDAYVAFNRALRIESIEPLVPRLRAYMAERKFDLVVTDGQVYPGIIAAHLEGIPFVSAFTCPAPIAPDGFRCDLTETLERLSAERREIFERCGAPLPFSRGWDVVSPVLNLGFVLPELVPGHHRIPRTELVGPSINRHRAPEPFPWERLDDRKPLLYVSFGTLYYDQPELLRTIAIAGQEVGAQVVMVVGDLLERGFQDELPGSVIPIRYGPQLELLDRASAVVHHGGANSVMESVYHATPMLVVPLVTDQPINGEFVTRSGIGRTIDKHALTVGNCAEVLRALLAEDGPERAAVERLSRAYRRSDGAMVAVGKIKELLENARARA